MKNASTEVVHDIEMLLPRTNFGIQQTVDPDQTAGLVENHSWSETCHVQLIYFI